MSINLLKVVSTLNEHADPFIDSQEYNDIIHGRQTREVQGVYRDIEFGLVSRLNAFINIVVFHIP